MQIVKTSIDDLLIIKPNVFKDSRGYFMESYKSSFFNENILKYNFVQDNESESSYGTIRGLHFQKPPYEQAKLVRVILGEVLDVVVDLRPKSLTFGKHISFVLSAENKNQLLVPRGFAHGFSVLSRKAIFSYKVDNIYSKDHECGIRYNDQSLKINWKISKDKINVSEKDMILPTFKELYS